MESRELLDSKSALNVALSKFCFCAFFRISLDFVIVSESIRLDSVNVLDSVDSKFL